jgi:hypothetical protein
MRNTIFGLSALKLHQPDALSLQYYAYWMRKTIDGIKMGRSRLEQAMLFYKPAVKAYQKMGLPPALFIKIRKSILKRLTVKKSHTVSTTVYFMMPVLKFTAMLLKQDRVAMNSRINDGKFIRACVPGFY